MGSTDGASDSRSDAKPSARQMANEENEKLKQKLDSLTQANNVSIGRLDCNDNTFSSLRRRTN